MLNFLQDGTIIRAFLEEAGIMSDEYTEVTTQGYFSRLGGSIIGMLVGFLFLPAAVILLYWNEGRAVDAIVGLEAAAKQVVEIGAGTLDAAADGKLVHLSGDLSTTSPAKDPVFGVTAPGLIRLKRDVEMYQWREDTHSETHENVGGSKTTETTYTYTKVWDSTPIGSGAFHHPEGHGNPQMAVSPATFDASDVKLGAYRLGPTILSEVSKFDALDPGSAAPPGGYRRDGAGLYRGNDPGNPAVGDLKVHFEAVQPQTYSVVAALTAGTLGEFRGARDYPIAFAAPGDVSAAQQFKTKASEESTWTWILRGVGFAIMLVGFLLIARPLSMVLAILPFIEGIAQAGAFLVALILTIPLTLIVIALAWIAHRPLIGGVLIVAAIGSLILFQRMRPRRLAPAK
jgi:hypothetical protein